MKRPLRSLTRLVYAPACGLLFLVLSLTTLVLVLVLPGLRLRRAIAHHAAGAFLLLAGMPVRVLHRERLPKHPCVVVANHASYLDGVILKAALPPNFSFVIKKEMVRVPLAGLLLRRIGSEFVDRVNRHSGAVDTRRLLRAASRGQSLAFFPEGTFTEQAGLARFHSGAFIIAARTAMPVVPVVIRGARHNLPAGTLLPRPGRIEVEVLGVLPVPQNLEVGAAAEWLKEAARPLILAALGEPDLASSPSPGGPSRPGSVPA